LVTIMTTNASDIPRAADTHSTSAKAKRTAHPTMALSTCPPVSCSVQISLSIQHPSVQQKRSGVSLHRVSGCWKINIILSGWNPTCMSASHCRPTVATTGVFRTDRSQVSAPRKFLGWARGVVITPKTRTADAPNEA
jgi:hypothetical protein